MALVYSALLPHSPAFLDSDTPDFSKLSKTLAGFKTVAKDLSSLNIDSVILVTAGPVGPLDPYSAPLANPNTFSYYGLDKISMGPIPDINANTLVFDNEVDLLEDISSRARPLGIKVSSVPHIKMDAGASIVSGALFGNAGNDLPKMAVLHLPYQTVEEMQAFGAFIGAIARASDLKIALCGVGNMSSRLRESSPAGYKPEGKDYDELVQSAIKNNDFTPLLKTEPEFLEAAGQDSALPLGVLIGAAGADSTAKLVSYEAPLGIGYGIVSWKL